MRKSFNSRPEKKKKQGKELNVSELQTPSLTMMHWESAVTMMHGVPIITIYDRDKVLHDSWQSRAWQTQQQAPLRNENSTSFKPKPHNLCFKVRRTQQNSNFFFLSLTYFKEILGLLFLACSNVKIITLRETSCHDMKHQGNSLLVTRTHGKKLCLGERICFRNTSH